MFQIPKIIVGSSVNELNDKAYELLLNSGKETGNRNVESMGNIHVEYDVNCVLTNPMNRHLVLNGRKSNIFALIGESIWVLAGRQDMDYLSEFLPRARDFSDDGHTWYSSYGARLFEYGQIDNIIHHFKNDGLYTRRATATIYHPNKDTASSLVSRTGKDFSKDISCNQWLNFWVDNTNRLNMKVIQRSGDAIWGAMSINLTEFSMLHELIFNQVQSLYPEVKMGTYNHSISNFHIYEATSQQAKDVLELEQNYTEFWNDIPLLTPIGSQQQIRDFFFELSECVLSSEELDVTSKIEDIFNKYEVPIHNNILFLYVYFSQLFIFNKRLGFKGKTRNPSVFETDNEIINEFLKNENSDYLEALRKSSFRNFEFKGL